MSLTIESTTSPQSEQLVRDFLQTHYSCTLATASDSLQPHAAVVYFKSQGDLSLLFVTKTATQKYQNILINDLAAIAAYDEKEQLTLQASGRIEIIDDHNKRQEALNNIFTLSAKLSMTEFPPIEKLIAGDYVVLRFIPQTMRLAVYARPDSQGDDLYETLLFSES